MQMNTIYLDLAHIVTLRMFNYHRFSDSLVNIFLGYPYTENNALISKDFGQMIFLLNQESHKNQIWVLVFSIY